MLILLLLLAFLHCFFKYEGKLRIEEYCLMFKLLLLSLYLLTNKISILIECTQKTVADCQRVNVPRLRLSTLIVKKMIAFSLLKSNLNFRKH